MNYLNHGFLQFLCLLHRRRRQLIMDGGVAANDAAIDSASTSIADADNFQSSSNLKEMKSEKIEKTEVEIEVKPEVKPEKVEQIPQIPFTCKICDFKMMCQYKGKTPRFAKNIQFTEECYLIQDPFSPPPGNLSSKSLCEHFIVIGSDCSRCASAVCQLNSCSIFYRKFYCGECAHQLLYTFPAEVQSKIRKFCKRP